MISLKNQIQKKATHIDDIHKDIEAFAEAEQLTAHANSIKVRFEGEE